MKSIVVTYPYFQSLPKGIKKLLVTSESLFFGEAKAVPAEPRMDRRLAGAVLKERNNRLRGQAGQSLATFCGN